MTVISAGNVSISASSMSSFIWSIRMVLLAEKVPQRQPAYCERLVLSRDASFLASVMNRSYSSAARN